VKINAGDVGAECSAVRRERLELKPRRRAVETSPEACVGGRLIRKEESPQKEMPRLQCARSLVSGLAVDCGDSP
jgi:hypothetical protein